MRQEAGRTGGSDTREEHGKLLRRNNEGRSTISRQMKSKFLSLLILLIIVNDYSAAQAASIASQSDEIYEIKIDLPAEEVSETTLTATIPAGMIFDAQSLAGLRRGISARRQRRLAQRRQQPDTLVLANYGDVDNSQNQDLLLTFRSLVADVESVANGRTLPPIRAELAYRLDGWRDADLLRRDGGRHCDRARPGSGEELLPAPAMAGGEIECTLRISHTTSQHRPGL